MSESTDLFSCAAASGRGDQRRRPNTIARTVRTPSTVRPGRKPDSFFRLAVGAAILHLDDRAFLEFNALAQIPFVKAQAQQDHPGKIWRNGLCLRRLLKEAIQDTIDAADGNDLERLRFVLLGASSGETLTGLAADLGVRRESLSRGLWSTATALVWERLKGRLMALD